MIKGVNKRVVEINNPDSIYFEKAIFYLKPNVRELPAAVSENEIRKYITNLGLEEFSAPKHVKLRHILLISAVLCSAVGIFLTFIL
ncbi:MAG: hypothetical protein IJX77_05945 [Ruminococcus sp.]|nr:hypothetical protein [Ruminococcus sp.]